ncbi:MAG TPA: hypothetical protein VFB13_10620 [Reyranella sp.]|nr:hypothetical protein [Reyranella sp.]
MAEPRVAHALFCDEIRTEPSGRQSFVGIRSGDVTVGVERRGLQFHFAVVAWLICDPDDVPPLISLRVYGPPGRRLLSDNQVRPGIAQRRPDSTKLFIQLSVERISLPLSQEGDLEVSIETDTGILRAARLRIRFAQNAMLHPAPG